MKIRGNTIGTPLKPEKNLVKATDLTEEEKAQARANIGAVASVNGTTPDENGNVNVKIPTGITKTLLWENASIGSSFSAQQIAINGLTGYQEIEILFRFHPVAGASDDVAIYEKIPVKGSTPKGRVEKNHSAGFASRIFTTYKDVAIQFMAGYLGTAQNGTYMVPHIIYGIKGVQ